MALTLYARFGWNRFTYDWELIKTSFQFQFWAKITIIYPKYLCFIDLYFMVLDLYAKFKWNQFRYERELVKTTFQGPLCTRNEYNLPKMALKCVKFTILCSKDLYFIVLGLYAKFKWNRFRYGIEFVKTSFSCPFFLRTMTRICPKYPSSMSRSQSCVL